MDNLTSKNVLDTFMYCLFYKEEDTKNKVFAEGVNLPIYFHPERLKNKEPLVSKMLSELPDSFRSNGDSFMKMNVNKDGVNWSSNPQVMEQLLLLGIAIGKIQYLQPRDCWGNFEGGMPYIFIKQ